MDNKTEWIVFAGARNIFFICDNEEMAKELCANLISEGKYDFVEMPRQMTKRAVNKYGVNDSAGQINRYVVSE